MVLPSQTCASWKGPHPLLAAGRYLGLGPVLGQKLKDEYGMSKPVGEFGGAVGAGIVAASLSHPLDTIKTCMQGDVKQVTYGSTMQARPNIPPRSLRIASLSMRPIPSFPIQIHPFLSPSHASHPHPHLHPHPMPIPCPSSSPSHAHLHPHAHPTPIPMSIPSHPIPSILTPTLPFFPLL